MMRNREMTVEIEERGRHVAADRTLLRLPGPQVDRVHVACEGALVSSLEMAESAHELFVLEVDVVQMEGEVALGEGLEIAQAARNHLGHQQDD